jgi:hypothetical protein
MIDTICEWCGTALRSPKGRRWCNEVCRGKSARDICPGVTALNLATTAAFEACAGTHTFDERYVVRDIGGKDHVMTVCVVCEVPIPVRYQLWNGKVSEKGYTGWEAA